MTRVVRVNEAGPPAPAPPEAGVAAQKLLRDALRDTHSEPVTGPLLVPLPAVGMSVVADVAHVSPVGVHRFARIALGTSDGGLDPDPGPDELAAALRAELAARSAPSDPDGAAGAAGPVGARAGDGAPGPDTRWSTGATAPGGRNGTAVCDPDGSAAAVLGPDAPRDPVAAVEHALQAIRRLVGDAGAIPAGSGTPTGSAAASRTDLAAVLLDGLLPRVAAGNPGPATEQARLAALIGRLAAARDDEAPGPVRDVLVDWLDDPYLWRCPVLHPAARQRVRNPLVAAVPTALADPPVPERAGPFRLRRARPDGADLRTVAGWMRRPEVTRFFGQPWPDERWARELAGHGPGSGTVAVLVEDATDPAAGPIAYLEFYRPARHALTRAFATGPDDLGVHVCVGAAHRRGTGGALLGAVAEVLLAAEPGCPRLLAEPDARNAAALGAFRRGGFTHAETIALPHKDAAIVVRGR
ncbi:GNAT family N-acetyltransferase [Pseudonocardia nantongensis]|uniref:GNAT family N-acetyltransferase n=1 Tax=Pseudonocardia nantongensis TaxID=1181885 RepID=UPI00397AA642